MTEAVVIIGWLAITGIVGLNGFAAGIVGILHAWRSRMRRGSRIVFASATAGLLPASYMLVIPAATRVDADVSAIIASAAIFAVAMGASLPGAIVVARKLAQPGDDYRAFE